MAESPVLPPSSWHDPNFDRRPASGRSFVGIVPAIGGDCPPRSPKALLPILHVETEDGTGLRPVAAAEFALACMQLAGVRRCLVIVPDTKPEIARYLGNGADHDMALGYLVQPTPLGLVTAIDAAYSWVSDEFCCLALPDLVFRPADALDQLCQDLLANTADLVLGVFPVTDSRPSESVCFDAAGNVLEVLARPSETDLANRWGAAAWSPAFVRYVHQRLGEDPASHPSIGPLINDALAAGLRVRAIDFGAGEVLHVDSPQDMKRLTGLWSGAADASVARLSPGQLLAAAADYCGAGDLESCARTLGAVQAARPHDGAVRALRAAHAARRDRVQDALRIAREGALESPGLELVRQFGGPDELAAGLVRLGGWLIDRGDLDRAAAICHCAVAIAPDHAAGYARLGWLALRRGRLDEALARAWHVVELAPDARAHHQLGEVLSRCGHNDEARSAFLEALRLDPENAAAHRALGSLFAAEKDIERADHHLQRAIMLDHTDVESLCVFGWLLHDTDRLERAEAIARLAVTVGADDPFANHLLGWILKRRGRLDEARVVLEHAVALAPELLAAVRALIDLELAAGDVAAAEAQLRESLRLVPDDPDLHRMLAWALHDRQDLAAAEQACRRAIELAPDRIDTRTQLAWILIERGQRDAEAIGDAAMSSHVEHRGLDAATGIAAALVSDHPNQPEGYWLMGEIQFRKRLFEPAEDWLRRALRHGPRFAQALGRLGWLLALLDRRDEAERTLRAAIEANADYAAGYRDLAFLLERQGRFAEAEALLRAALERRSGDAHSWLALGRLLENDRRDQEAIDALERAVRLDDRLREGWWQIGRLAARGVDAARRILAAQEIDTRRERLGDLIDAAIGWLSFAEYVTIVDDALAQFPSDELLKAARQFGHAYDLAQTPASLRLEAERCAAHARPRSIARHRPGRRPRVAYVGNFLHSELTNGYIAFHDHERFDIALFTDDDLTKLSHRDPRLATYRLKEIDLEQTCSALEIDLVVDVVGPFPRRSLLEPYLEVRRRVAPVQCLWLNTFGTTGSTAYDYVITDTRMVPPGQEHEFSERIIRLPHCQWFYTARELSPEPGPLPALANGHVTFGVANRGLKLNDAVLALWAELMARLPSARMRFIGWHTDGWRLRRHILATFAECGVAAERLDFLPGVEPDQVWGFYRTVDMTLDTFPFNGGMTTFESLWMGVPVVAVAGDRFTARQAESILHVLNLEHWVAPERAAFVPLAMQIGSDLDALADTRRQLRDRMRASPLCDGAGFARDLEALFVDMIGRP